MQELSLILPWRTQVENDEQKLKKEKGQKKSNQWNPIQQDKPRKEGKYLRHLSGVWNMYPRRRKYLKIQIKKIKNRKHQIEISKPEN